MKIAKFGGSSVADAANIKAVCDIIKADPDRRIVVVSAPGKRNPDDTKVTDLLIAAADAALSGTSAEDAAAPIIERFASIQQEMGLPVEILDRIKEDLVERLNKDQSHKELFIDRMKAAGEDNCAWLFAEALRSDGVDAVYVNPGEAGMVLGGEFGDAVVLDESYEKLAKLKDYKEVVVFPGFFGVTADGEVATFPRGGSDITGAVLAAAVKADAYENFTDVDSVYSVNPNLIENPNPIAEMTYREMRELSYAGFGVFHDEAVAPCVEAGVPIWIRNTHNPEGAGTRLVPEREHVPGHAIGIGSSSGFCSLYVSKYMMNREIGFGRRLLQILEEEGISYEHTPSGIDNMSVIISESQLGADIEAHVTNRIKKELGAEEILVERGLALVMIVGEGMHLAVGIAAQATAALAEAEVNIEMINQGSSEISMMFGVKSEDADRAVTHIYRKFFD